MIVFSDIIAQIEASQKEKQMRADYDALRANIYQEKLIRELTEMKACEHWYMLTFRKTSRTHTWDECKVLIKEIHKWIKEANGNISLFSASRYDSRKKYYGGMSLDEAINYIKNPSLDENDEVDEEIDDYADDAENVHLDYYLFFEDQNDAIQFKLIFT